MEKVNTLNKSVSQLEKWHQKGQFNFDLALQRGLVWDDKRKSMLVHSILIGYPIPAIYVQKESIDETDIYNVLDGKQRLNALFDYIENKYPLSVKTPPVGDEEVAGRFFKELPKDMQDNILGQMFTVYDFKGDDEEIVEFFVRLNSGGLPLSQFELTRSMASTTLMNQIHELCKHPFFQKVTLSKIQIERHHDEEMVLHALSLIDGEEINFSSKDIREYAIALGDKIPEWIFEKLMRRINYLNKLELEPKMQKRIFKKIHIPILIETLCTEWSVGDYQSAITLFFENLPSEYKTACSSGSGRRKNVETRVNVMQRFLQDNLGYPDINPEEDLDLVEEVKEPKEEDEPNIFEGETKTA